MTVRLLKSASRERWFRATVRRLGVTLSQLSDERQDAPGTPLAGAPSTSVDADTVLQRTTFHEAPAPPQAVCGVHGPNVETKPKRSTL
jgi:hypothetical protein